MVADVYDETRRALDSETLKGIDAMLAKHRCHSILEVGVGTGRVSMPLKQAGYEVVGVDISRRMVEKARLKGLGNLVLAEGSRTPFRARVFDAALMAHVFHLLEDPLSVMREAARVSKVGVFGLVRKSSGERRWFPFYGEGGPPVASGSAEDDASKRFFEERRERFKQIAEKYHWSWEASRRVHNWARERELLESHHPDDLTVVSEVTINETLEERIARFEKGGFSFMSRMPVEMRQEIASEMRAGAASFPRRPLQPRHEVYELALWTSKSLLS